MLCLHIFNQFPYSFLHRNTFIHCRHAYKHGAYLCGLCVCRCVICVYMWCVICVYVAVLCLYVCKQEYVCGIYIMYSMVMHVVVLHICSVFCLYSMWYVCMALYKYELYLCHACVYECVHRSLIPCEMI